MTNLRAPPCCLPVPQLLVLLRAETFCLLGNEKADQFAVTAYDQSVEHDKLAF